MKNKVSSHFSATNIAYMALFTALAFAMSFLEFPIFPAPADFLKLDFANVFFMIEGFIFGPVEAILSIGAKELLCLATTKTGGAGQLANFIMSTAYIIVPSIIYRFKKGRWWVALYLVLACIVQVGSSLVVNRYINFPIFAPFMGRDGAELFRELWMFVLYFNIIKSVSISVIVFLIYKPLSRFIRLTAAKVEGKRKRATHVREETSENSEGEESRE